MTTAQEEKEKKMRLIDADALREQCDDPFWCVWLSDIDHAPTIDAVPVVRCRDCRFRDTFNCGMQFYGYDDDMNLRKSDDWTMDDGFCYWGEKKDV